MRGPTMRSANLSLTAGSLSHHTTSKPLCAPLSPSCSRLGPLLVAGTLVFTLAVFAFCDRQDEELASAGINIEELTGEAR